MAETTLDARSRSEIVVPVFGRGGTGGKELIAVLDIDSDRTGAFGEEDRTALEHLMGWFQR